MENFLSIDQVRASKDGIFFLRFQFRDQNQKRTKAFLCINLNQREERISILEDNKSLPSSSEHSLCHRLKKLCPKFRLQGWFAYHLDNGEKGFYLPLFLEKDHHRYALQLQENKPPVLDLIDSEQNISLCRCLYNAQFTKAKNLDTNEFEAITKDKSNWKSIDEFLKEKNFAKWNTNDKQIALKDNESIITSLDQTLTKESLSENHKLKNQRDLAHKLLRKQKIILKNIDKASSNIPSVVELETLEQRSQFLKSISHKYKKLQTLTSQSMDPYHDKALTLGIDLEQSLGNNLDTLYKKKKSLEKSRLMQTKILENNQKKLIALQSVIKKLRSDYIFETEELKKICEDFEINAAEILSSKSSYALVEASKSSTQTQALSLSIPYLKCRSFVIHDQTHPSTPVLIQVSRNAKEADALVKQAKGNDFWFHCVQGTGSHVILPFQKRFLEVLPPYLERMAMILAIHYSDHSKSFGGEVYTSKRHNLRKPKDLAEGLWLMDRAKSKFIRYTQEELDEILKTLHKQTH